MADDRYGNEGDTGRKPIPRPDREFEDLDDSFSERGSTFFQEYAEQYEEPAAARPEPEDFGFDDIAVGGEDEPEPGSARDRARSRARGRSGGRGGRAGAAAGRLGARARSGVARTRGGGGGRGGGRRPASSGGGLSANNPLVRMGGIALFVILLVVVLAFVIKDCRHDALVDSYKQYVNSAAQISEDSATQGQKLLVIMQNSKGEDAATLQKQVRSLANQADELRNRADGLSAPGKLGDADNALLLSLQYRANGLRELEKFLPQIIQQSDETAAARTIKGSMQRFLASDVIMRDSFIDPTSAALRDEDITSVAPPDRAASAFLRGANDRFASDAGAKQLVQPLKRQKGSSTGSNNGSTGNLRGTRLVSVVAEPSGTQLSTSGATVTQSTEFKWRVTILNGGNFVESGIKVTVTLTYPSSSTPVDSQEATITTISPDKEASVTIPGPPQDAVELGQKGTLQVSVAPVKGEQNTGNNSATYPVTITFG